MLIKCENIPMFRSKNTEKSTSWKCVEMRGYKLFPYDSREFESTNFCVHVERLPCCYHTSRAIISPVLTNDGVVSEKKALDSFCNTLINTDHEIVRSPVTRLAFSPYEYQRIRFSCNSALPSKIDPEKSFSAELPIVAFLEIDSGALLMVEKKDDHGCGMLTVYFLDSRNNFLFENFQIVEQKFTDTQYSILDQNILLTMYLPNPEKDKLYTINTTIEDVNKLENEIRCDSNELSNGLIQYTPNPNTLTDNLFSLFCGLILNTSYHNSRTLFLSSLMRAGIKLNLRSPISLPRLFYSNSKFLSCSEKESEKEENEIKKF